MVASVYAFHLMGLHKLADIGTATLEKKHHISISFNTKNKSTVDDEDNDEDDNDDNVNIDDDENDDDDGNDEDDEPVIALFDSLKKEMKLYGYLRCWS